MYYLVVLNILLLSFCQSAFGEDCAPDLSSVGDSVITLSDELSDAYTAEESCKNLSGYLTVTRDPEVKQMFMNAATQKYAETQRVWIYYNNDTNYIYKYSLSSNETSPWVSPQHLGHLWYLDLHTLSTFSTKAIPIKFCKAKYETGFRWSVKVGTTCGDWNDDFVLYGLPEDSSEAGYKGIYAYNQKKAPWSMRLTDVKDDDYNDFNNLQGTFYAPDIKRVWIYYNKDQTNVYKYSLSSNETLPWVSPQHLGHLWYIDLYNSSTNTSIPIRFCEHSSNIEKWTVRVNKQCHKDWPEEFVLYGPDKIKAGYKAIYAYDESSVPGTSWSMRLTDVKDDNYNRFTNNKGTFYAPASDVFIGARFNETTQQWKWSNDKIADEFTDVNHTVCLQKVLDYGVNQTSNRACSETEEVYYSCQVKAEFKVEAIECNSTALKISWNLLPLAIKFEKDLQVKVFVNGSDSLDQVISEQSFTILSGLLPRLTYDITVTGSFVCGDPGTLTSSFVRTMGPGQPNDVTHPYVIKSEDSCHVTFANPLSGESFDIMISANNLTGKEFNSTFYCTTDICQIPFNTTDYFQGENIEFTVNASNCEGSTETRTVAGTCVGLGYDMEPGLVFSTCVSVML